MGSRDTVKRWDSQQLLLIAAACFALVCIGFFLAVLWGASAPKSGLEASQSLTSIEKTQIVNNLSSTTASSTSGVTASGTSVPTAAGASKTAPVPTQQADQNDSNANAKLQVLNSLNGSQ